MFHLDCFFNVQYFSHILVFNVYQILSEAQFAYLESGDKNSNLPALQEYCKDERQKICKTAFRITNRYEELLLTLM